MVDCEPALSRVIFDLHSYINFTDGFPVIKKEKVWDSRQLLAICLGASWSLRSKL